MVPPETPGTSSAKPINTPLTNTSRGEYCLDDSSELAPIYSLSCTALSLRFRSDFRYVLACADRGLFALVGPRVP